jgi:hypothetical protein
MREHSPRAYALIDPHFANLSPDIEKQVEEAIRNLFKKSGSV